MKIVKVFNPRKVLIFLLSISFVLVIINLFLTYLGYKYYLWHSSNIFLQLHLLFTLSRETTIPNLFSTFNLLFGSVLLWVVAKSSNEDNSKERFYWYVLSVVFLYLAFDDGTGIHEKISAVVYPYFNFPTGHPLYYSWVIPYSIIVFIGGLFFLKFVLNLPSKIKYGVIGAGLLYVGAALGLEFLETVTEKRSGLGKFRQMYDFNLSHNIAVLQELLEMIAISFFNYVLLKYLELKECTVEFSVRSDT